MKRLLCTSLLSLMMLTAGAVTLNYVPQSRIPIEMIAFGSLDRADQNRIPSSPKDSTVTKVTVDADLARRLGTVHYGKEIYAVTFHHTGTATAGNLIVYVDPDLERALGKINAG